MINKKTATLPRFDNVANPTTRAWNRCNVFLNVCADLGKNYGKQYVEHFTGNDRAAMLVILANIKQQGYEATRRSVGACE